MTRREPAPKDGPTVVCSWPSDSEVTKAFEVAAGIRWWTVDQHQRRALMTIVRWSIEHRTRGLIPDAAAYEIERDRSMFWPLYEAGLLANVDLGWRIVRFKRYADAIEQLREQAQ
jgi:hypothetical protein